jgi:hypothetical protein
MRPNVPSPFSLTNNKATARISLGQRPSVHRTVRFPIAPSTVALVTRSSVSPADALTPDRKPHSLGYCCPPARKPIAAREGPTQTRPPRAHKCRSIARFCRGPLCRRAGHDIAHLLPTATRGGVSPSPPRMGSALRWLAAWGQAAACERRAELLAGAWIPGSAVARTTRGRR